MPVTSKKTAYLPGYYPGRHTDAVLTASEYVRQWEKEATAQKPRPVRSWKLPPTVCFSRKIGVGALEIAEILAEKIRYRVADRLIIEQIAATADLSEKTVAFFDERYPGKRIEAGAYLFAEKSFVMSSFARHLVSAVYTMAETEPTIFVGRGAHLILPREMVLAVRIVGSRERRAARLSVFLKVSKTAAGKILDEVDREQREFFKKAYGKKDASVDEFDLVINCDHIGEPRWAAAIVQQALIEKFSLAGA